MRRATWTSSVIVAAAALVGVPHHVEASPPDTTVPDTSPDDSVPDDPLDSQGDVTGVSDDTTTERLPLIPVPVGCTQPPTPHIVFVGQVIERDYRTVRFEIEQVRSGRPDPFADGDRIDVRYGIDAQYLDDGESYLISALVDLDLGLLVSRVTEPVENFGGDEVIGVSETDVDCPVFEDPMRTLDLEGRAIDATVLEPFFSARVRILSAFLVPFAVALVAIFVLASFRLSVSGLYRTVVDTGRRTN